MPGLSSTKKDAPALQRERLFVQESKFKKLALRGLNYLTSTLAPASSSFFLMSSASALEAFSLTALGAPSTIALTRFTFGFHARLERLWE